MNNKEIARYSDEMQEIKVQCVCGTKTTIPVFVHTAVCRGCGKKIRNNTKAYFVYQLRKAMKEAKNE